MSRAIPLLPSGPLVACSRVNLTFTYFEHYFANPQEVYTSNTWYIACLLCQLVATMVRVELRAMHPEDEQVMPETCRGP
jgi:hypothetical protein